MPESSANKKVVLYACSGASDVGEIADRVARKLRADGVGIMSCLSGIGANAASVFETAVAADVAIVIDGCQLRCGKSIFQRSNIDAIFFGLNELGLEKGQTPVIDDVIAQTAKQINEKLEEV
ncbi:MAG: putative zinc-binding protein [Gammaproteobacteria bacterium]|nr:putative zinc-binding protein [Gammaproteobacteria bacterium]